MDLSDEPVGEREASAQPLQAVVQRGDVVRDFHDILHRRARLFLQLEQQEVRERRLGPFDLRGEHGLLAHVGVEKEVHGGQQQRDAVQPAEGEEGPFEK